MSSRNKVAERDDGVVASRNGNKAIVGYGVSRVVPRWYNKVTQGNTDNSGRALVTSHHHRRRMDLHAA